MSASLRHTVAVVAAAFVLLRVSPAAGQPVFSAVTEVVVLHVGVTDRHGSAAGDLTRDDFRVFEDSQPQTITYFASQDAPATIGLIIDNSSSMQPIRDLVIGAAVGFAEASNPKDEMFALVFNEQVRAVLPPESPFTSDVAVLRAALTEHMFSRGRTGLFDALAAGLDHVAEGHNERTALIVLSDGGDNASRASFADVLTRAQSSNAVVYTVALADPLDSDANPKLLERIANATGGEAFQPHDARQVADVLARIARDIRKTYTVGYISTNPAHDGTFRHVRVEVDAPAQHGLRVHTRAGYLAAAPSGKPSGKDGPREP
ncbi:MAG: VWA domain-containing protein [Betaproteobacteria bacterium]